MSYILYNHSPMNPTVAIGMPYYQSPVPDNRIPDHNFGLYSKVFAGRQQNLHGILGIDQCCTAVVLVLCRTSAPVVMFCIVLILLLYRSCEKIVPHVNLSCVCNVLF